MNTRAVTGALLVSWVLVLGGCGLFDGGGAPSRPTEPDAGGDGGPLPEPDAGVDGGPTVAPPSMYTSCGAIGGGTLMDAALSGDGSLLAVATSAGQVRLLRTSDGALQHVFFDVPGRLSSVALSADGSVLAATHGTEVQLWRVATRERLGPPLIVDARGGLALSADGATLATAGAQLKLWRVADGTLLRTIETVGTAQGLTFSPDGSRLAGVTDVVHVWRTADGSLERLLNGTAPLAFSPDGTRLVGATSTSQFEGAWKLWKLEDGTEVGSFTPLDVPRGAVRFSTDGTLLIGGSKVDVNHPRYPFTVTLWRVSDGAVLDSYVEPEGWVHEVGVSPSATRITVAVGMKPGCSFFDACPSANFVKGRTVADGSTDWQAALAPEVGLGALEFSPDGALLASGRGLWRTSDLTLQHRLPANALGFSPDGGAVVVHGVRVLRLPELTEVWASPVPAQEAAFSPDGTLLATVSTGQVVRLWRYPEGTLVRELAGGNVAFSPDGSLLAMIDGRVYRVSDGTLVSQLQKGDGDHNALTFSPDSRRVLLTGNYSPPQMYRVEDGAPVATYTGGFQAVFSPDGGLVATGGFLGHVSVSRAEAPSLLVTLKGHGSVSISPTGWGAQVDSVAFSADGRLASHGADDTVRLWCPSP